MTDLVSLLTQLDSFCQQLAIAIQDIQTQLYAVLALIVLAAVLAFPPKDDPDQI
jgi:hypothetical protein